MTQTVLTNEVVSAKIQGLAPQFVKNRKGKVKGLKAKGIRYEKRLQLYLSDEYGDNYLPSPWVQYQLSGVRYPKWCQPDGLLFNLREGLITVVEAKLKHVPEAWRQMDQLYVPVLRSIFDSEVWNFATIEVCNFFDCATSCPKRPELRRAVHEARPGEFAVMIWRP